MGKSKYDEDLYRPVYKKGSHLAASKNTKGAYRGTTLDDDTNKIDGQAEWIKVDPSEYEDDEFYYNQDYQAEQELSPEQQEWVKLLSEIAILLIDEVIAPRAKAWWQDKVLPAVKEMWGNTKKKKRSKMSQKRVPVQSTGIAVTTTSNTVPKMFLHELDDAHEKYLCDMTSEEAQRELLDIFILSAIIAAKIRRLSNARIKNDGGSPGKYIEGKEIIQKLSDPTFINSINKIIEKNPMLLQEKSTILSEILGRSIVLEGQYISIESTQIKEQLMF